jgi:hypothetical protein
VESVFYPWLETSRSWSDYWRGSGFALYLRKKRGSLTVWSRTSSRSLSMGDSQQTLNCALSVDLLWNQRFRSDKRQLLPKSDGHKPSLRTKSSWAMKVRSVPLKWDFKLPRRDSGVVFNGEFDSGSERTLAAWIRHASRARFFPVAIQGKV